MTDVIVLNGGSSSGKSSIARRLQELLDELWVTLGVDDLLGALAPSLVGDAPARPGRQQFVRFDAERPVAATRTRLSRRDEVVRVAVTGER
jgi:chloramphenicol 3-O-phosphotransferase